MENLALGDFTHEYQVKTKDETGKSIVEVATSIQELANNSHQRLSMP